MILQTEKLFEMQEHLQQRILQQHKLTQEETKQRRILAFLVEVGELANETRCFKYWSTKGPSEKDIILEEYVDGIHFLLCMGLDLGHTPASYKASGETKELSEMFMDVYTKACIYRSEPTPAHYDDLFSFYVLLGEQLGFANEDICNSYYEKNKENFRRQDTNY